MITNQTTYDIRHAGETGYISLPTRQHNLLQWVMSSGRTVRGALGGSAGVLSACTFITGCCPIMAGPEDRQVWGLHSVRSGVTPRRYTNCIGKLCVLVTTGTELFVNFALLGNQLHLLCYSARWRLSSGDNSTNVHRIRTVKYDGPHLPRQIRLLTLT